MCDGHLRRGRRIPPGRSQVNRRGPCADRPQTPQSCYSPGVARLFLLASILLGTLAPASSARAYEDQLTLGLGAGYGHAVGLRQSHGVVVEAAVGVGLGLEWTLRLRGRYGAHPDEPTLHVAGARAELLYVIDVLELVPYFGLGAGGMLMAVDGDNRLAPTVGPALGVDYLLSRELAVSLDLRGDVRLSELEGDPFYLSVTGGVRLFFEL